MSVLAIDPGLPAFGWALGHDGKCQDSGWIVTTAGNCPHCGEHRQDVRAHITRKHDTPPPPLTDMHRMARVEIELFGLLAKGGFSRRLSEIVIEVPSAITYTRSTGANGKALNLAAMQKLSATIGAITVMAWARQIAVRWVPVCAWKGRRSKRDERLASGVTNEHEADAIGLLDWWWRIGSKAEGEGWDTWPR